MATELIPFNEFDVRTHIRKQLRAQKGWAVKKKRNMIDSKIKLPPPPKGPHSSRPEFISNGTANVTPPPWDGALHRRPGADQSF
jgi:hypothetical protein